MRMEIIKRAYWNNEVGYETALAQLEALGMWEGDADNWLHQDDDIKREAKARDKAEYDAWEAAGRPALI